MWLLAKPLGHWCVNGSRGQIIKTSSFLHSVTFQHGNVKRFNAGERRATLSELMNTGHRSECFLLCSLSLVSACVAEDSATVTGIGTGRSAENGARVGNRKKLQVIDLFLLF